MDLRALTHRWTSINESGLCLSLKEDDPLAPDTSKIPVQEEKLVSWFHREREKMQLTVEDLHYLMYVPGSTMLRRSNPLWRSQSFSTPSCDIPISAFYSTFVDHDENVLLFVGVQCSNDKLLRFKVVFSVTESHFILVVFLPVLFLFTTYHFMPGSGDSRLARRVNASDLCIGRPIGCLTCAEHMEEVVCDSAIPWFAALAQGIWGCFNIEMVNLVVFGGVYNHIVIMLPG